MEMIRTDKLTFTYPGGERPAIEDISIDVQPSEFVLVCGQSGCGKTTLLRCLKREITPHGNLAGDVFFHGKPLSDIDAITSARGIGFVRQNPENQIVTDTVWHELAFGLENIGQPTQIIRRRVAETAHFFGINEWFEKKVFELSGGQKQILSLAAVMAMQPEVLMLDEPTAQLDPIAAKEFLTLLSRINRELGTTVIMSEHRLEDVLPLAGRVLLMEDGRVSMNRDTASFVREIAVQPGHVFNKALPSAVRISSALNETGDIPVTVREGRLWLKARMAGKEVAGQERPETAPEGAPVLSAKEAWFRYDAGEQFVLRGLNCDVYAGRMLAVVGGNASGKTTALNVLSGQKTPVRGSIKYMGKNIRKYKAGEIYKSGIAMLSQDPKTMFVYDTLQDDLMEAAVMVHGKSQAAQSVAEIAETFGLTHLLTHHPYDLSGGEQQKAAIAKLLLLQPRILLLDEPTKGIDVYAKDELAALLKARCAAGDAVVVVTHDVEFAAKHADEIAMIFNGEVICGGGAHSFFAGNTFYTTSANRISRGILEGAVTAEDVIELCKTSKRS